MKLKKVKGQQKYAKKLKNQNLSAHFLKNRLQVTRNKEKESLENPTIQKKQVKAQINLKVNVEADKKVYYLR